MLHLIDQLALVRPGDRLLDIGCGPGAMVVGLLARTGTAGSYVGFDVHRPSVEWCRRRYGADPRCRFELARLASPYARKNGRPVEEYAFPIDKGQADFVLAKSVFTHLLPAEAEHYLSEIHRALRLGAPAVVTAFLFAPDSRTGTGHSRFFRGADPTGRVRSRSRLRPQAAVAYERDYFFELVTNAGLRVQWLSPGFFPGDGDCLSGQDVLLLGH
jgi:SAM-dependent methyltransferase